MSALRVVFSPRAERETARIDAWWRANRTSAPDLFFTELRRMLSLLALSPALGTVAASERTPDLRRALLDRTQHHVYFRAQEDCIEVVAVWHASRGRDPGV
ncbi:MAG TPA: type II toxin-antitoxin system RelE/ParE family toxin [Polyangiaceae bacterium]